MNKDTLIVEGSFDPISNEDVAKLIKQRKERNCSSLCFLIRNDIFDSQHHPSVKEKEERIRLAFPRLKEEQILFVNEDESLHPGKNPESPYIRIDDSIGSKNVRLGKKRDCSYEVFCYILSKGFYFLPLLRRQRKTSRYLHSLEVAKMAYQIAKNAGLDEKTAFRAGLYHDCAKDLTPDQQEKLVREGFHPEFSSLPAFAIHQAAGPELRRTLLKVDNRDYYEARLYHCTGKGNRSERQKVIYAADKVEPTRKFPTKENREALLADLDEGFIHLLRYSVGYFLDNQISYKETPLAKERYSYYLGGQNA